MKKLLCLIATLAAVNVYAQLNQFGFTGGATLSNYKSKQGGNNESANNKVGFTVGVLANLVINKNLIFQPAVKWVQKGTKDEQTTQGVTAKASVITNSIELPLNLLYRNNGFFIGGGPCFAMGVSGKFKVSDGSNSMNQNIKFGSSDNDDLKAFDFGINVLSGYQFKSGFFIAANYNLGLSNLAAGSATDDILKSRYAGIGLGYLLGGNGRK